MSAENKLNTFRISTYVDLDCKGLMIIALAINSGSRDTLTNMSVKLTHNSINCHRKIYASLRKWRQNQMHYL